MGDFNFGGIEWPSRTLSANSNPLTDEFLDTIDDLYLVQHVTEPTRGTPSSFDTFEDREGSILDLIFTSMSLSISDLTYLPPLNGSDHAIILFTIHCSTQIQMRKERY